MRSIRGSRNAQRSMIARVWSLDPHGNDRKQEVHGIACQIAASEGLADAFLCIMPSLHKTSGNALVEPRISIEIRRCSPCPDAADALVGSAWLPRPRRRRADLWISGVREASSRAHGGSLSAKHLAGSIHVVFASVCVVYWATGIGECGQAAHSGLYRLVPGGSSLFCPFQRRPRRRLAGGRVHTDRRRRLWRVRCVPDVGSISNSTIAGRGIDHHSAWLSLPGIEAARVIAGVGSTVHPPADGTSGITPDCMP